MDTQGHIRMIAVNEDAKPNEVPIDKLPDPKCKDCFGRGFQRFLIENVSEVKPCHCVRIR
jgi:hypothetical protein